jgi:hypothetical protein
VFIHFLFIIISSGEYFLEQAELYRTLQSLACGKIRLLNKKPMVNRFLRILDEMISEILE